MLNLLFYIFVQLIHEVQIDNKQNEFAYQFVDLLSFLKKKTAKRWFRKIGKYLVVYK